MSKYSYEFKKKVVNAYLNGEASVKRRKKSEAARKNKKRFY